jgi:excinuclease ABC subunit C
MDGLFRSRAEWSFGPNSLDPHGPMPQLVRVSASRRAELRAQVREQCPRRPGVYGMVSPQGELVYVGKAKCLRSRLLGYFRTKSRDPKAGRLVQHSKAIVWEYAPSEIAALLRELELIQRWRPRFNVQGQPGRRRPIYVCLGRHPAPYAFLTRQPPAGALAVFGPIPAGQRALEAVRVLNDCFRLRDCPQSQEMVFSDQTELFPIERRAGCLRYEIGTCIGPCLGACSRAEYRERVDAAKAFLAGTQIGLLEELRHTMLEASAALAFERAAAVRDKWQRLRWLHERLDQVQLARQRPLLLYPVEGDGGDHRWYLIQGGRVVAAIPMPKTAKAKEAAARQIASLLAPERSASEVVPASEMDGILLLASWFRRHPREKDRVIPALAGLGASGWDAGCLADLGNFPYPIKGCSRSGAGGSVITPRRIPVS